MMPRQSGGTLLKVNDSPYADMRRRVAMGATERGGEKVRPRKFEEQVRSGGDASTASHPGLSSRTGRVYALHMGAWADVFAAAAYHAAGGGDWQISHQSHERQILFLRGRMASHSSEE